MLRTRCNMVYIQNDVEDHLGFIEHVPLKNYTVDLEQLKKGKDELSFCEFLTPPRGG